MTMLYRLTVRTTDGTRYISDYEHDYEARSNMEKFFVTDRNLVSYKWSVGDDIAHIKLDKVCGATVTPISFEEPEEDQRNREAHRPSESNPVVCQRTYLGQIHVEEAN